MRILNTKHLIKTIVNICDTYKNSGILLMNINYIISTIIPTNILEINQLQEWNLGRKP
jgi:hypothetical protein